MIRTNTRLVISKKVANSRKMYLFFFTHHFSLIFPRRRRRKIKQIKYRFQLHPNISRFSKYLSPIRIKNFSNIFTIFFSLSLSRSFSKFEYITIFRIYRSKKVHFLFFIRQKIKSAIVFFLKTSTRLSSASQSIVSRFDITVYIRQFGAR